MEFEINMSEMPLGKLSKENIQKGVLFWSLWNSFICFVIQIYHDIKEACLQNLQDSKH